MIQWKFTFDKDEEQDWLNDYCREGWAMVSFFAGLVTFVPCRPGEFIYQIDLLPGSGLRADDYEGYVSFMGDMDVEVLQRWGRWVYLRRRAEDGPFEVYTDTDSKIQLYRRIRKMFLWVWVLELVLSINVFFQAVVYGGLLLRCSAAVAALMLLAILQGAWKCTQKIQELERLTE